MVGATKPSPPRPLQMGDLASKWGNQNEPLVSILVPTYNHQHCIEDALCGILGQVTRFPFEVIVRDDASTDNTPNILAGYQAKYNRVLRLITETENQFGKGISFMPALAAAARGRFVALCAGDDYWIDHRKLQSQIDVLQENEGVDLVSTASVVTNSSKITRMKPDYADQKLVFPYNGPMPFVSSWCFRATAADLQASEFHELLNEDTFIFWQMRRKVAHLASYVSTVKGDFGSSNWTSQGVEFKIQNMIQSWAVMSRYFHRIGDRRQSRLCLENAISSGIELAKSRSGYEACVVTKATLRLALRRYLKNLVNPTGDL